jgi:hypothetical protein
MALGSDRGVKIGDMGASFFYLAAPGRVTLQTSPEMSPYNNQDQLSVWRFRCRGTGNAKQFE